MTDDKPLVLSSLAKERLVQMIGLETLKDEVRREGFNVILIVNEFAGPIKERIEL